MTGLIGNVYATRTIATVLTRLVRDICA